MSLHSIVASSRRLASSQIDKRPLANARRIFAEAVAGNRLLLLDRQQIIAIDAVRMTGVAPIPRVALTKLVARAIVDVSNMSSRGARLSIGVQTGKIIVRGAHAIDLPESHLELDERFLRLAAELRVAANLAWDQGRGPRLTLTLPVGRRIARPARKPAASSDWVPPASAGAFGGSPSS